MPGCILSDVTVALLAAKGSGPATAASSFAVLANASVTCTNGSITGDVGTFLATPTGSITKSSCPITGTAHVGDAAAKQAFKEVVSLFYTGAAPNAVWLLI